MPKARCSLSGSTSIGMDTWGARIDPNRIEGDTRIFQEEAYPVAGKGSELVKILAIGLDLGYTYAERLTVARIHTKACDEAGPQMRLVQLVQDAIREMSMTIDIMVYRSGYIIDFLTGTKLCAKERVCYQCYDDLNE